VGFRSFALIFHIISLIFLKSCQYPKAYFAPLRKMSSKDGLIRLSEMIMKVRPVAMSIITGAAFGSALTLSGVYSPSVIISQMQLRNFHMLESFLTASAISVYVSPLPFRLLFYYD